MFLFETILFYKEAPCFYNIYWKEDNSYYCEAQPHFYYSHITFPNFSVVQQDNKWHADGLEDQDLVQQLVKDLDYYLLFTNADAMEAIV